MNPLTPYLKIARLHNALMTGAAVALGFWLGNSASPLSALFLLVMAGASAAAFGNVINDISDVATDRISHSNRPLPRNELSLNAARLFAAYLAATAMGSAAFVSLAHAAATALPLILLAFYTRFLKRVPLAGNTVISLLVGYAILYGALGTPRFTTLIVPAVLAFLLNCVREIVKDLQDLPGDRAAGLLTTASLPLPAVKTIMYAAGGAFLLLLFVPVRAHHFGTIYAGICLFAVLPLHLIWLTIVTKKNWRKHLQLLSLLVKLEMAVGLTALAADRIPLQ